MQKLTRKEKQEIILAFKQLCNDRESFGRFNLKTHVIPKKAKFLIGTLSIKDALFWAFVRGYSAAKTKNLKHQETIEMEIFKTLALVS